VSANGALILTYHAIEEGSSPLCVDPALFRRHLDCLTELGATTITVAELGAALRAGELPERAVAITFDDGCASAVRVAAPLLAERKQKATFFCVAGHLGGWNDWPSQRAGVPRLELAAASELAGLAAQGFEIGAHGMEHAPLRGLSVAALANELRESRTKLAEAAGSDVRCLAFPYGLPPDGPAADVVEEEYDAACAATLRRATVASDRFALPRVDVHYVRRGELLKQVVRGRLDAYLRVRDVAARGRRLGRRDGAAP
jgi:peptidoglycan/xylan/chitin deacetylase (PgdA/CDA1 family)